MLDPKFIRGNVDLVKCNQTRRGSDPQAVDEFCGVDTKVRETKQQVDKLRQEKNVVTENINVKRKAGEDFRADVALMRDLNTTLKEAETLYETLTAQRETLLSSFGNILHADVPAGKDDSENVELRREGDCTKRIDHSHVDIIDKFGYADFTASAEASGHGFYYLKGGLALMNQALIQYTVHKLSQKGYEYIEVPLMLRKNVLAAAVDTAEFDTTIYSVGDDMALIGTSEHGILAYHSDTLFAPDDLPKKYVSYSMCFRKEVGAHGINEKGLWRTHQFNKIEQFIFCKPDQSDDLFFELLQNTEELLKELGLPYRVLDLCTGDLSAWKQRSYDLEVWRPSTGDFGEVASLSNCTDYQARELNIKVQNGDGKDVVHTLNNTAIATSRIMVAILEHYSDENGVNVPAVLQPYMGVDRI